jgi:Protein of unknown function (DUF3040)
MALPVSEQLVLGTIENDLRTRDPELADAFDAFTAVTDPGRYRAAHHAAHHAAHRAAHHAAQTEAPIVSCRRADNADRATVVGLAAFFIIGLLLTVATLIASA